MSTAKLLKDLKRHTDDLRALKIDDNDITGCIHRFIRDFGDEAIVKRWSVPHGLVYTKYDSLGVFCTLLQ